MAANQMSDVSSDTGSVPTEEQQTLDLVQQLLRSFQYGRSSMVFACGGTVPIPASNNTAQQSSTTADAAATCQPVILRWDPRSQYVPARVCKLQFPLDGSDSATLNNIQQLLEDTQPATLGYQGRPFTNLPMAAVLLIRRNVRCSEALNQGSNGLVLPEYLARVTSATALGAVAVTLAGYICRS